MKQLLSSLPTTQVSTFEQQVYWQSFTINAVASLSRDLCYTFTVRIATITESILERD